MTANPHKGQAALTIGEREFTLEIDFNMLVFLEEKTGKGIEDVFAGVAAVGKPKLSLVRLVFFAALQKHHAADVPTEEAAGALIMEAGLSSVTTAFRVVTENAFGQGGEDQGGGGDDGTPKERPAADGTGPASLAEPSKPA